MTTPSDLRLGSKTAAELTGLYAEGDVTPVDVVKDVIDLAHQAHERFAAVAFMDEPVALAAAEESARRWKAGTSYGPLDGIPVSIKDSMPAVGTPWRHGSIIHEERWTEVDSAPVKRLHDAGAVVFAKTTMPDLGMVASGLSSIYGIVRNPWNTDMTPGGSSSGAGALVASGVGPLSIGTDLGGSVRAPAAHNGLFGIKPTQGRIAYAPASNVRSPGPLARTVRDMETLLGVIGAEDESDLSCLPGRYAPVADFADLAGLRIAIVKHMGAGMPTGEEEWQAVVRQAGVLEAAGAEIVEIPDLGVTPEDQDTILATFRFRVLAEMHGVPLGKRALLLPELADFAESAYQMSGLAYAEAMNRLEAAKERVRAASYAWDFVLTPVMSVAAFPANLPAPAAASSTIDHAQFTAWFNQTGQPAGVVPGGLTTEGMPVGVQVVGKRFCDAQVVALMRLLDERNDVDLSYPYLGADASAR
jgi:aspartyl-tRNA(Asn)/glutamyl-tRNA(Gln) amidotransferase subunit A